MVRARLHVGCAHGGNGGGSAYFLGVARDIGHVKPRYLEHGKQGDGVHDIPGQHTSQKRDQRGNEAGKADFGAVHDHKRQGGQQDQRDGHPARDLAPFDNVGHIVLFKGPFLRFIHLRSLPFRLRYATKNPMEWAMVAAIIPASMQMVRFHSFTHCLSAFSLYFCMISITTAAAITATIWVLTG